MLKVMRVKTSDLKKGDVVKVFVHTFRTTCLARIEDNCTRHNTRICTVYGSSIGGCDDMGSVYAHNIVAKVIRGKDIPIEHTPQQLKVKKCASIFEGNNRIDKK